MALAQTASFGATRNGGVELWTSEWLGGFTYENLAAVNTSWQIAGTGDFTGLAKTASCGATRQRDVELWNSNGAGGFTYENLGRQHQLADRRDRRFQRGWRRRHPVAQRLHRRRRALELEWLGGLHLRTLSAVNPNWQIAGTGDFTGNGEDGILWRNTHRRCRALELEWLGGLHLRTWTPSIPAGRSPEPEISLGMAKTVFCGATSMGVWSSGTRKKFGLSRRTRPTERRTANARGGWRLRHPAVDPAKSSNPIRPHQGKWRLGTKP